MKLGSGVPMINVNSKGGIYIDILYKQDIYGYIQRLRRDICFQFFKSTRWPN